MSSEKNWVLTKVAPSAGALAVDVGGGDGALARSLEARGYRCLNVDLRPGRSRLAARGDVHRLPVRDGVAGLVVSSDSLEHFADPVAALREVRRVLRPDGTLVVWVPFMHPFHGDDYFRFTPLGLGRVFGCAGLEIVSLESPLHVFSVVGQAAVAGAQRLRMRGAERTIERAGAFLDRHTARFQGAGLAFAAAYLVVGRVAQGPPP